MKILQIFGWVVAVHLAAFIAIFASPGCSSGPRTMPTPDATAPSGSAASTPSGYLPSVTNPQPVDLGTPVAAYNPAPSPGYAAPTRPGSAAAVAVTPAKPVENVAPISTYTVERGDSLWSIAKKNGMTVAELAKANSISTGTALKPGRKLIVPGKVGAPSREAAPVLSSAMSLPAEKTAMPARPSGEKYTVQVGESLGVIARKFQVTVGKLAEANNITDPSKVRAGQQLIIPGGAAMSVRSPAPVARPAAADSPASTAEPPSVTTEKSAAPTFDISAPPPGQDLDAGLKSVETTVPTIRVEEAVPPKN